MTAILIAQLPPPRRQKASINEDATTPGVWRVEFVDYAKGGLAELTVFVGREAEARARAFAHWRYTA
jgi:hypothetical protein